MSNNHGRKEGGQSHRSQRQSIHLETLKKIDKPIIDFKIFTGGQMPVETETEERRALIEDAYNTIFTALKTNDLAAMGIFQRDQDQIGENVSAFNEWAAKQK